MKDQAYYKSSTMSTESYSRQFQSLLKLSCSKLDGAGREWMIYSASATTVLTKLASAL